MVILIFRHKPVKEKGFTGQFVKPFSSAFNHFRDRRGNKLFPKKRHQIFLGV